MRSAADYLALIHALPVTQPLRIMNVCGGHERSIAMAGLRRVLPPHIQLIAGPGCPVCVCPEEDIYLAIQLALQAKVMLLAFGDMLRVPVNVSKAECRSLEQAKAQGAEVRPIASPLEALTIAQQNPQREVVFFAAGFETTMAPVAAMLLQGAPENLSVLLSGRLTWPAVSLLLNSGESNLDALIAPGHVATVMGAEQWQFVVAQHRLPVAVAGFSPQSLLAAMYSVLRQKIEEQSFVDNCYSEVVRPGGNATAQRCLSQAFTVAAGNWRGIGVIADSAYELAPAFAAHNARRRFTEIVLTARQRSGQMPAGCDCARVVLGKINPDQCSLFGRGCLPASPVGPCMVSDEGACRIWWSNGVHKHDYA